MSDYVISIGADASLLNQELQKAADTLNQFSQGAELTGRTLKQNLGIAEQAQRALKDQIDLTRNKQREANAEYQRAQQTLRAANKPIQERIQQLKGLNIAERKRRIETWQQTEAYKRERIAIKEANIELRKAAFEKSKYTATLRQYENSLRAVNVSTRNLKNANRELAQSNGNLGSTFKRTMGVANQLAGVFGFGLGVYGLMRAFRSTIFTIRDFDSNIRSLAAISGATADEMENLSRVAILVGGSSKYGADGVAEMMTQLAKMGFAVEEINNMAEGITKLAVASGEELEPSAATVASIVRAMGMDAADTAQIVDTLALSFTQSALDLSKFRESMKYVAPLAKQANFTLEDTAAILAKLADAGISGSLSGTSLRNIFSSLADQSSALSKALGGNITDFDTFIQGMDDLVKAGLTTEDMFKLIDRRAVTALSTIANNTGSIIELKDQMENANDAADKMANIQMQSIAYQTTMAGKAWDSFILAMDKGDNALSNMIRGTFRAFSNTLNDMTFNMERQSKEIATQMKYYQSLESIIRDANRTNENRLSIIEQIRRNHPELVKGLEDEALTWERLTGIIANAVREKRAYFGVTVLGEDILRQETQVARLKQEWEELGYTVTNTFDLIDATGQMDSAIKQMQMAQQEAGTLAQTSLTLEQAIGRMDGTIKGTNLSINDFAKAFLIQAEMRNAQSDIEKTTQRQRELSFATEEAGRSIEYFSDEVGEFTSDAITAFKNQAIEAINAGKTIQQAYSGAYDDVRDRLNEWLISAKQASAARKEEINELQSQDKLTVKQIENLANLGFQYRANELRIAAIKKALSELGIAFSNALSEGSDDIRQTENMLRLEQRLAEARARIALDGIELEEELSRIRKRYADEIVEVTMNGDEKIKTLDLNRLQREIDLQNIQAARIRQTAKLEEDAHKRRVRQLEIEQELEKINLQGEQGKTARETALLREMALFDAAIEYEKRARELQLFERQRQLEREWEITKNGWTGNAEELERLHQNHLNEIASLNINFRQNEVIEERKSALEKLKIEEQLAKAKADARKKEFDLMERDAQWQREQAMYEAERVTNLIDALDIFGQRTQRIREQERANEQERLEAQRIELNYRLFSLRLREQELKIARQTASEQEKVAIDIQLQSIDELINDATFNLEKVETLIERVINPDVDISQWDSFISAMRGVAGQLTGIYQGILDERYRIAQEERSLLDRRISEMQRDLDLELRLNEQGFASNVQALMASIEKEKAARDKALAEEKKQAEEKRRLEKVLQTINLLTAVTNIIKAESKWGLPGIASAAAGLAGLWMLWGNQSSKANQSVQTYEKGGHFLLQGKSHAQGGVPLTPRHEAQGGELVSVFNRRATNKYGSEIRSITDAFNKGNYVYPTAGNTEIDTSDIKAIRKILEKESVTYSNGYKIIKKGNTTIRCRLN